MQGRKSTVAAGLAALIRNPFAGNGRQPIGDPRRVTRVASLDRNGLRKNAIRRTTTLAAAGIAAAGVLPPAAHASPPQTHSHPYTLTAFTPLPFPKSTVLMLDAAFIGLQPLVRSIPKQLNGDLCKSPSVCKPVDYFAWPGGEAFNDAGADQVLKAIAKLPANERIMLAGGSMGGEVIYSVLRKWAANPAIAPDPSRVTWVSFGNPENRYGGEMIKSRGRYAGREMLPLGSPYKGIEVIRQYDGWADYPDDPNNLLAFLNAGMGQFSTHIRYTDVNLNDPRNVVYTPDNPDGSPGNVTYVYVPTDIMPLVDGLGFLSPILDKWLRPYVEKAYNRPVQLPDPHAPARVTASAAVPAAARAATSTSTASPTKPPSLEISDLPQRALPEVQNPASAEIESPAEADQPAISPRSLAHNPPEQDAPTQKQAPKPAPNDDKTRVSRSSVKRATTR